MATPVVFAPVVTGLPFSGTDHNNNMAALENSFSDVATYVISGLTIAAGTGLAVNVAAGVAVTGCEVNKLAFVIGSLTPSTTVHLYLNQDGTGTFNLTGVSPAKAVKLGTALTGVATVTSVAMGRTSGRQQFVQPQNLVHGGVAAGITSAGHPRAVNLAQWNATQAEGFEVFGTLPAGAVSPSAGAVILAPNTPTRNLIVPTADANPALLVRPFSDAGAVFVNVQNAAGTTSLFGIGAPTGGQVVAIGSANDNDVPLQIFPNGSTGTQTEDLVVALNFDTGISAQVRRWAVDGSSNMYWGDKTTTAARKQADIIRSWVTSTDASRKAKVVHRVYDTAARSALQLEADGANPLTKVLGSFSAPEVATSANITLDGGHFSIFEDTTGGNKTVTLPTAVGIAGRIYCIKNTGTGVNTLTIATTSAQTIDGAAGASTSTPQACLILQSDGANWQTLSSN